MTWKTELKAFNKEDWSWQYQFKLAGYTALAQLTGSWKWYQKAKGLSDLKIHILRERAKVTKAFYYHIMYRDNWYCYLCNYKIAYKQGNLEHDIPLVRWGYTTEENCHASHERCNQAKGTMTAEEYRRSKGVKEI